MLSIMLIVLMDESIRTYAATTCSSDSDCLSHEGCLPSDSKCYHRFNVSDFSVLELLGLGMVDPFGDDDTDSNSLTSSFITLEGDALSPIFDNDLSTYVTAEIPGRLSSRLKLTFPSDRWVKYMKMVLRRPSFAEPSAECFVEWSCNDGKISSNDEGNGDIKTEIEDGKYESHTANIGKLPAPVHLIDIDVTAGPSWMTHAAPKTMIFYIHFVEILGSYHSPLIPSVSATDISMISMQDATVSTQPCCHDYGFMVKEDAFNLRDASLGSCERTVTTQCCGNTVDFSHQSSTYRCGLEGEWHPVDESQNYDEGLCDISWFNTTTADIVGTVVYGENILFHDSAFTKADDIGAVIQVFDFCQCNYTINECEGEDIAVCGSQETYDEVFAADCWNNVSWTFTDDFQSEDCWANTLENNPDYEHLLWEPCSAQSFHGMHSEFVHVSTEQIHNGACNCTYHLPPIPTTTTTNVIDATEEHDDDDAVQCVFQVYIVTITIILAVVFT